MDAEVNVMVRARRQWRSGETSAEEQPAQIT